MNVAEHQGFLKVVCHFPEPFMTKTKLLLTASKRHTSPWRPLDGTFWKLLIIQNLAVRV